jgi:hypothetical protein
MADMPAPKSKKESKAEYGVFKASKSEAKKKRAVPPPAPIVIEKGVSKPSGKRMKKESGPPKPSIVPVDIFNAARTAALAGGHHREVVGEAVADAAVMDKVKKVAKAPIVVNGEVSSEVIKEVAKKAAKAAIKEAAVETAAANVPDVGVKREKRKYTYTGPAKGSEEAKAKAAKARAGKLAKKMGAQTGTA